MATSCDLLSNGMVEKCLNQGTSIPVCLSINSCELARLHIDNVNSLIDRADLNAPCRLTLVLTASLHRLDKQGRNCGSPLPGHIFG